MQEISVNVGDRVDLGDGISLMYVGRRPDGKARIGVEAPDDVRVQRYEIAKRDGENASLPWFSPGEASTAAGDEP